MRFFSSFKEGFLKLLIPGSVFFGIIAVAFLLEDMTATYLGAVVYLIPYIALPVFTLNAFSFLFKRNKSDAFFALPVKRTTLFFSRLLAILIWTLILYLLPMVTGFFEDTDILWCVLSDSLYVISAFTLGSILTGRRFSAVINAIICAFVPVFLYNTVLTLIYRQLPNVVTDVPGMPQIERYPWSYLLLSFYSSEILPYLILSVIFLALSCILFIKRKSENAEKSAPTKLLRIIHGSVTSFSIALLGVSLYLSRVDWGYAASVFGVAILAPLLYEFILTKRAEGIKQGLVSLGISALAYALMIFLCSVTATVINNQKIDIVGYKLLNTDHTIDTSERGTENVYVWGSWLSEEKYPNNAYSKVVTDDYFVTSSQEVELVSQRYYDCVQGDYYWSGEDSYNTVVVLLDKNGSRHYRYASFTDAERDALTFDALEKDKEYIALLADMPKPDEISTAACVGGSFDTELYKAFYEEMMELSEAERVSCTYTVDQTCRIKLKTHKAYLEKDISVTGKTQDGYYYCAKYKIVPEYHPKTYEMLRKKVQADSVEKIKQALQQNEFSKAELTLTVYPQQTDYPDKSLIWPESVRVELYDTYKAEMRNNNNVSGNDEGRLIGYELYGAGYRKVNGFLNNVKELIENNLTEDIYPTGVIKLAYYEKGKTELVYGSNSVTEYYPAGRKEYILSLNLNYNEFMSIASLLERGNGK